MPVTTLRFGFTIMILTRIRQLSSTPTRSLFSFRQPFHSTRTLVEISKPKPTHCRSTPTVRDHLRRQQWRVVPSVPAKLYSHLTLRGPHFPILVVIGVIVGWRIVGTRHIATTVGGIISAFVCRTRSAVQVEQVLPIPRRRRRGRGLRARFESVLFEWTA